ncbi:MAG: BMP family ABC transporter substrate-binding protein, partial [Anaerotruncus massiliensis (ex Togo et al. 2019)]
MVIPQSLGDSGPMDSLKQNLEKAAGEFGLDTSIYEALEPSQHEEVVRTFAREGVDMIICAMPTMVEALKAVAPEFPDTKFCMVFPLEEIEMDNVVASTSPPGRATTCAASSPATSKVNKAGHVIGAEQSALIANYNAFAGGKSVNPDFDVLLSNANSFDDPAKGKEAAISLIDQGCDLIITDCAATAMGVIEAGEEKGVFIIGDSSPHNEISPAVVLADTMTQFGPAMYSVVSEFANGSFSPGTHFSTLAEGGIGITVSP